jgi:hypothetical protein
MLEPSLKGPNAENAWFQLLSLRHLCRIVECEADSARQIAEGMRGYARVRSKRSGGAPPLLETAAFAGQTLSPAG